jgi:hypothetical protein
MVSMNDSAIRQHPIHSKPQPVFLRHRHQAGAQIVEFHVAKPCFNFNMGIPPDRRGLGEQFPAPCGQNQNAASAIGLISRNADKEQRRLN